MSVSVSPSAAALRGRGVAINPPNRFERLHVERAVDDEGDGQAGVRTQFFDDASESLLVRNDSPDLPFSYGLNVYRGCEHGCAYYFARQFHEYLGWSAGLDFETKILVKRRSPELLRRELASPRWQPELIAMSGATDCYQPAERHFQLTRRCLEVLGEFRNPVGIVTKSHLVTRDRDLLVELARHRCINVLVTITTMDPGLAARLEPRAARPAHRIEAIRALAEAGIPVGVMVAPVIPGLTDHEIPSILDAAANAGASQASYTLLRLPASVQAGFLHWLEVHEPGKKDRILSRVREIRGGKLNVSEWGRRMHGEGIFADQIHALFEVAARRCGLGERKTTLSTEAFRRPGGTQLSLGI